MELTEESVSQMWKLKILLKYFLDYKAFSSNFWYICIYSGFPPIREFREIFEDFFQSGKSGKNGFFREKNFKSGNFFSKPFSNLLNL